MAQESMWGEVPKSGKGIKRPFDYLDEQADILSRTYSWDVRGEVTQEVSSSGRISIDFDIYVPSLDSYRYSLLRVTHRLGIYPLTLRDFTNNKDYKCEDEEQFKQALRETLSSPAVREVIKDILTLLKK